MKTKPEQREDWKAISNAQVGDLVPINIMAENIPGVSVVIKREVVVFEQRRPDEPHGIVHLLLAPRDNHRLGGWYTVELESGGMKAQYDPITINRETFLELIAAAEMARAWIAHHAPADNWANNTRKSLNNALANAIAERPEDGR